MLGFGILVSAVMDDEHGVDRHVAQIGRSPSRDVFACLSLVGLLFGFGHPLRQLPDLGEGVARQGDVGVALRAAPSDGPQDEGRAVGEVESVQRERSVFGHGRRSDVSPLGCQKLHLVAVQSVLAVPDSALVDASGDLLPRFEGIVQRGPFSAQQGRNVVAPPSLSHQQGVERGLRRGVCGIEIPVGILDVAAQLGGEQQRGADARPLGARHGRAVGDGEGEIPFGGRAVGIPDLDGEGLFPAGRPPRFG